MSAKELSTELLKKISKKLDINLEHLVGSPFEKELTRAINEYGDLQWRLAHAHREMFDDKARNDAL